MYPFLQLVSFFVACSHPKEVCGVPRCSDFNLWLYVVIPVAGAAVLVSIILVLCCVRRKHKKPLSTMSSMGASSPRSLITQPSTHNYSEMEMNALIPQAQPLPPKPRAREFPITSVRFNQELGEGAFGKVYRGDLGGIIGGCTSSVAIKTLRPGAQGKTKQDFLNEIEMWSELRHPNIVCLLGTVLKDEPQCMVFEYLSQGDLHEFLLCHSPKSDMMTSVSDDDITERILDPADMSFMAIQIAAGMEYLAGHHYVHRDLASRNCLVGENLTVKISDFGMARDKYVSDYYRVQTKSLLPVRWMPAESMLYGKFTTESDVWSYGVLLWEVYSYGLQPYYGYSNQEVIEMIRTRQLLPCPEDCPSRMYAFMVECWHEVPSRRPSFSEIHARLRHWEGMSNGYQSTNQSMCNASQHSNGSQHSSTGPSNNTGSTSLSQHHRNNIGGCTNGGYSQPFGHLMNSHPPQLPPVGMVQMANGPKGGPQTVLLGPNHAGFGTHIGPMGHSSLSQNGGQAQSVASLQMV
jgi:receptor tyrosine kinase-like orphan receptor 1